MNQVLDNKKQYKFKEEEPSKKEIKGFLVYFKKLLGSGKYGKVYEGMRISDQLKVAVKVSMNTVAVDEKSLKELLQSREIVVMKNVKSENLIQFYDCKITKNNVYLFIEFCNGGNLSEYMKNNPHLSDERIIEIFQQISNGFRSLVEKNIIHRDLKPDNIMMHDGIAKISDFGFARFIEGDPIEKKDYTLKGTPLYVPPQVFTEKKYSSKFDVWSFGCILYELLYGRVLHENVKDLGQLKMRLQNFKTQKLQVPKSDRNEALVFLLQRMLEYDEYDRISWNEIFENDLNRMNAQQFLSIYKSQFEIVGNREQNNSFRSSIQNKIQNQNLFSQIIQQFDNASFPQFFIMRWTNAILVLWCFYVESILKLIELKKKVPTYLVEQEEFNKTEQAQLLIVYLRDSYKEIQNQLESFKIFLQQWIEKPSQLIGQNDNEDIRFYRMIDKADVQGIINVIEKNINMKNQFKNDISMRLSSIIQMVKQEF